MLYNIYHGGFAMKFTFLELFLIFWLSAFLWVLVEYFFQRLSKRDRNQLRYNFPHDEK